jgi:hypothetical protein
MFISFEASFERFGNDFLWENQNAVDVLKNALFSIFLENLSFLSVVAYLCCILKFCYSSSHNRRQSEIRPVNRFCLYRR